MTKFSTREEVFEWAKQTVFELCGSESLSFLPLSDEEVQAFCQKMKDDDVDESLLGGKKEFELCRWVNERSIQFLRDIVRTLRPDNEKKVWNAAPNGLSYSQISWFENIVEKIPSRKERFAWYGVFSGPLKEEVELVYAACKSSSRAGWSFERAVSEGRIPNPSTWDNTINNKYIKRSLEELKKKPAFSYGDLITLRTPWKRKIDKAGYWSDFGTNRNEIKSLKEMKYAMVITNKADRGPHAVKGGKKLIILTSEGSLVETQERFMKKLKRK